MTSSDSMFLFELIVEKFRCFVDCGLVTLKADFKDVFEISLNNPQDKSANLIKKKLKGNTKIRGVKCTSSSHKVSATKIKTGQSLLITIATQELLQGMHNNKLDLSLWNKSLTQKFGSVKVPWDETYINYLSNIEKVHKLLPVSVRSLNNIYDEASHKKVATVKLNIKLTYFGDKTFRVAPITFASNTAIKRTLSKQINRANKHFDGNHGKIKTTYSGNKTIKKNTKSKSNSRHKTAIIKEPTLREDKVEKPLVRAVSIEKEKVICTECKNFEHTILLTKSKSYSVIEKKCHKPAKYIFGDPNAVFGNQVYCVNYCTVEKDSSNPTSKSSIKNSDKSNPSQAKFKFKPCDSECQVMKNRSGSCPASTCTLDLPEEAAPLISIAKCKQIECDHKKHRVLPPATDDRILLDLSSMQNDCCVQQEITETVEEVVGGVTAKMKVGAEPCFCSCECTFGFTKKTTFCKVCGGYEKVGEESSGKKIKEIFPCPYYHKLIDKNKLKTLSTSGSESKRKGDDVSVKAMKVTSSQKAVTSEKRPTSAPVSEKKSVESEKDSKKSKKKKKDDRFKFNYGYKAPQIGHSRCAFPCTGTLNNVPKKMGWLWTAEDIPGVKFRPGWKPGATNKHVVRLLRIARNPGEVLMPKKRRREVAKKPLIRPLLIVHKKDGEFTVTMETMKTFTKPRTINQHPYEDKPVLTYTIGRTEEENKVRQKKKEREQRRLERDQRQFIQSAFRDMCREICLKTYQQALGILPDAEDPECTCYPALPTADRTNLNLSCSCSEESGSIGSDTDSDEWIVEFTPPCATFKPTFKAKKILIVDNSTQYTYLDYRVKLIDRFGNPVPRFFKGPDGRQQCSDLGGFWSPDKKWQTINVDGYIAPDGRWAPNFFIGPSGETVEGAAGKFQTTNNKWLIVGIDGYVDTQGRWKFYPKPKGVPSQRKRPDTEKKGAGAGDKKEDMAAYKSEASWSCFGGASAKELSQLGIIGHGHDKKLLLSTLKDMLAHGESVKIPQPSTIFRLPPSKKRQRQIPQAKRSRSYYEERTKCRHSPPSDKGIIAVDDEGNKTYFRLKDYRNVRPKERLKDLAKRGISLSSFHVPCFHSFINAEIMKKQQQARLLLLTAKSVATQKF
ncbi:unnamed protein product [Leptosia nina]|uniref:DUF4776 domain-containing protein n=1 Tax=Leptosia nina TaxID=320188 RepID=A0AAV1J9I8_9NEOP